MANQKKCEEALKEIASAVNKMFSVQIPGLPGYDGERAVRKGREVMVKIREERRREGRLPEEE